MTQKQHKRAGQIILLVPLGILLLFMFGEIFSGDITGLQHLIQAAPIVFLAFLSIKRSFLAGVIISSVSLLLGILYAVKTPFPFQTIIFVELLLFLPLFISGVLLIISEKQPAKSG